jgi:ABC-type phosphate transport system auxiliary subunit
MSTLTTEEKKSVINQHIKTLDYAIYNADLELLQINVDGNPNQDSLNAINARRSGLLAKRAVLETELDSLPAEANE